MGNVTFTIFLRLSVSTFLVEDIWHRVEVGAHGVEHTRANKPLFRSIPSLDSLFLKSIVLALTEFTVRIAERTICSCSR